MLSMPGAGFVMIGTEFVFCRLKVFFNSPTCVFDVHQCLHGCPFRAPGLKIGAIFISDVTADQQVTRP